MFSEKEIAQFKETQLSDKTIYDGHILSLHVEQVRLPNGQTAEREIIHHHGAVAMLVLNDAGAGAFVTQWREPLRRLSVEIPAGKLEPGENDPDEAARRELNEEIGYAPVTPLQPVTTFYSSVGYSMEKLHLYFSDRIAPVAHKRPLDSDEFLQVDWLTLAQAQAAMADGRIVDAKTVTAIYWWALQRATGRLTGDVG
ncbi:NUDIX domain-containing protein [Schleiferilactobacillus shenzhenensis]|uniref:NudF n=1 Tax=Schleiferilactobacillus shenzhenensis LY-73 TaxID=1231336 RepID=U4TST6_9LACO|nr:NUDIX hydrolase [Schleiferilactobacillus shenzhenensis]ERL66490.1 NudF [Schleiferilactobacillus shenzhenensis LY-73]